MPYGTLNAGTIAPGSGNTLTIDGSWTAASQTCANLGTVTTTGTIGLGGKLTAGATEIEGSNFDINGGSIVGTTIGTSSHTTGKFTTCDATTDFTIGNTVITDGQIADTNGLAISLGGSAGDDFNVDSNKFVVEGDSGQCGIGIGSPGAPLHIKADKSSTSDPTSTSLLVIQNSNTTDGNYSTLMWKDEDGSDSAYLAVKHTSHSGNTAELTFGVRDGGSVTQRMRILANGRIVIGSDERSLLTTQSTSGVGTSATTIATTGLFATYGCFMVITGRDADATANRFQDFVSVGLNHTASITPFEAATIRGTPASRTYTRSSESLQLAMGSGNYKIQITCLDFNTGF